MSFRFQPLTVREVRPETADAFTIVFAKPAGNPTWDYLPGQYLTLQTEVNGERLRRAFSLSTSPVRDADLAVTIKCIPDGRVSNHLRATLQPGHTLEVLPPMGKFTLQLDAQRQHHYVLIGGGSGITPLMSMLRSVLHAEPQSRVTLLYGNRDLDSIIFLNALADLTAQHADRLRVVHVLQQPPADWTGLSGLLSGQVLKDLLVDILRHGHRDQGFYLCGPQPMMDSGLSILRDLGVADSQLFTEYYSAPLTDEEATAAGDDDEIDYEIVTRDVRVKLDGREFTVTVPPTRSILAAAIDAGLDPPYACEEGVCCTCRAKLLDGLVQMNEREGLSDEELEAGFVLTCQSHPLTADVVVEFG